MRSALSARGWGSRSRSIVARWSWQTEGVTERNRLLLAARLYLVCDDRPGAFLEAALRGGVDVVQLRIKDGSDERIRSSARRFRSICEAHGALFILNDRPDLALAVGADGVHVGQDDVPARDARELIGPDLLLGLSTHTPQQVKRAAEQPVDYIGVGPVQETPTKPGRPAVGLELVRYASSHAALPFFAIGGISAANAASVRAAGAERIAVVRALSEAPDPQLAARELLRAFGSPAKASVAAS
jgi:thiamine-phosphate pyrophosphorylase